MDITAMLMTLAMKLVNIIIYATGFIVNAIMFGIGIRMLIQEKGISPKVAAVSLLISSCVSIYSLYYLLSA